MFRRALPNRAYLSLPNCIIPSDINKQLIVVKDGNAQFTDVTTGVRLQNNVEITNGVAAGDSVVVTVFCSQKIKSQLR
jgi:membrane fusion protein (multidrug efflux system)